MRLVEGDLQTVFSPPVHGFGDSRSIQGISVVNRINNTLWNMVAGLF